MSTILDPQSHQLAADGVINRLEPVETLPTAHSEAQSRLEALIFLITDLTAAESTQAAKVALDKRTLAIDISTSGRKLTDPALIERHLAEVVDLLADAVVSRSI